MQIDGEVFRWINRGNLISNCNFKILIFYSNCKLSTVFLFMSLSKPEKNFSPPIYYKGPHLITRFLDLLFILQTFSLVIAIYTEYILCIQHASAYISSKPFGTFGNFILINILVCVLKCLSHIIDISKCTLCRVLLETYINLIKTFIPIASRITLVESRRYDSTTH